MARAIDKDKLITSMAWHDQQGMISSIDDVLDIIEAFPTLTPPNDPLTLEQLRKMDGQPAWVKVIGKTGIRCDGWCEVEIREKDPFAYVWWPGSEVEDIAKIEDYGKDWVAYAYHSAHIDREAWSKCGYCGRAKIKMVRMDLEYNESPGSPERLNPNRYPRFCPICGKPLNETAWAELEKRMGVMV